LWGETKKRGGGIIDLSLRGTIKDFFNKRGRGGEKGRTVDI